MLTRRALLQGAVGVAGWVVGFDPLARRWIGAAEAHGTGCGSFDDVPALDGALLLDEASRSAYERDKGNYVTRKPCAVLRPGSVHDVTRMVAYCRKHVIPVSVRGQAHSTHGQSLSEGLLIENRALAEVHEIGLTSAWVDTGASWMSLVEEAYAWKPRLTPPVLTGYTQLTIGGTLSMGGIGGLVGGLSTGLQVDHVSELEVVTGAGKLERCSLAENRDLFEAVLAGLGQYGVITKARVDLVPARQLARTYLLHYAKDRLDAMFSDLRALLGRGLDHVYVVWFPPGTTADVAQINATVFYDPPPQGRLPDDLALAGSLSTVPLVQETTYLDYVFAVDRAIDAMEASIRWSELAKPWFDVWLPATQVEGYVKRVVPTLTHDDIGEAGFLLMFVTARARATRPNLRLPAPDGSDWVFLFDILTSARADDAWKAVMLARNDRLFQEALAVGGVRYPIGTMTFTRADWERHYGERWNEVRQLKHRYDPANILGRGVGIFS